MITTIAVPVGSLSLVIVLIVSSSIKLIVFLLVAFLAAEEPGDESEDERPNGRRGHSDGQSFRSKMEGQRFAAGGARTVTWFGKDIIILILKRYYNKVSMTWFGKDIIS